MNIVEPLIAIIQRQKDYGSKLTALCIMAIINMCNFSEDMKDIFLSKNGQAVINDLLESKEEDILLNILKLIMTLITQDASETS